MNRSQWTVLLATIAQLGVAACDNSVSGGGTGGGAGSGGNGTGGNASATSSSSTSSSSTSSSTSSSSNSSSSGNTSSSGGGMLGMGECRTTADCVEPNAGFCRSPDAPQLCGICFEPPNPCTTDTECAMQDPTTICNPPACSCGASECMPGCMSDTDCKDWEHCSPGHRCVPDACATKADCPLNFKCEAGACARQDCTSDASCNGFCVNNQCYDMAGHCMLPPP